MLDYDRPKSIGRVRSFFGNVGILVRGYCYIRTLGPDGLQARQRERGAERQLPAQPREARPAGAARRPLHARVRRHGRDAQGARSGIRAMDIAKRLLDYGFHAPTVYFPLIVPEALMIEPTETESKETLDAFAETLFRITEEDAEPAARRAAHHADQPARRGRGRPPAGACMAGGRLAPGQIVTNTRNRQNARVQCSAVYRLIMMWCSESGYPRLDQELEMAISGGKR